MQKPHFDTGGRQSIRLGWRRALLLVLVVAGLFATYLSVELKRNNEPGFPLDDAWIHLTFARNIARGWGFAYNQGEPVAGSTSPLWTLLLAFFHLLTRNATVMVLTVKLLGAALLFVSAVFAFRIVCCLSGSERLGLAAGLAIATLGPMGWAMMSGMEVTLSVALTLAGIYYHLRFRSGWRSALAWALFGLAAWARPESLLLGALAALDSLLRRLALKQRLAFWRGFGIWLAIVLLWLAFNYSLSRTLFPLTFVAKAGNNSLFAAIAAGNLPHLKELLTHVAPSYFADFCVHLWRANPVLCLLVPVGLVGLVASAFRRRNDAGLLIPLVVLGYAPLIGLVSPAFGAAFQNGRYIGNVTTLAAVVAAIGVAYVRRWIRRPAARLWVTVAMSALAVFNVATVSVATIRNTTQDESSINRMQVAMGRWLAANAQAGSTIGCDDVGAIGYFSNCRIFDLHGLVTRQMSGSVRDSSSFMAFLTRWKPAYLAIFPGMYPYLLGAPFLELATYAEVRDNTASLIMFTPRPKTVAGVLTLDIVVQPVPVVLAIFKCDWGLLPPGASGAR